MERKALGKVEEVKEIPEFLQPPKALPWESQKEVTKQ